MRLEYVAHCAVRQRLDGREGVAEAGDDDDARVQPRLPHPPNEVQRAAVTQRQIREHDVGTVILDEPFRLPEGGGHADHLHAGGLGEEPGERIANELAILDDQDSSHGDAAALEMFVRRAG